MSLNARRFSPTPRSERASAAAEAATLLEEFGVDAPAFVKTTGPVYFDSFEYERACYCCPDCDGSYRNFLQGCEDRGVEVPAAEWAALHAREAAELEWEVNSAYREYDAQNRKAA